MQKHHVLHQHERASLVSACCWSLQGERHHLSTGATRGSHGRGRHGAKGRGEDPYLTLTPFRLVAVTSVDNLSSPATARRGKNHATAFSRSISTVFLLLKKVLDSFEAESGLCQAGVCVPCPCPRPMSFIVALYCQSSIGKASVSSAIKTLRWI